MANVPKVPKMSNMLWAEYQKNAILKPCSLGRLAVPAVWAVQAFEKFDNLSLPYWLRWYIVPLHSCFFT